MKVQVNRNVTTTRSRWFRRELVGAGGANHCQVGRLPVGFTFDYPPC